MVRKARPGDAGSLARLAEGTFRDTFAAVNTAENMAMHCAASYGEAIQAAEIADPSRVTLLCAQGDGLLGFAQLRWGKAPACVAAGAPGEIQRLYVVSECHGQGIAQELMRACLREMRRRRCDVVWLGVWEHNPRAIAFYRKFGFSAVGEQCFPMGDDPQRDIVMSHRMDEPAAKVLS